MASKQLKRELTTKQRFWLGHIEACANQGEAMSAYAATHGLSLKQFYNWKWRLGQKGVLKAGEPQPATLTFQAVEIVDPVPSSSKYRIGFANGLWIDVAGAVEYTGLQPLLTLIKGL